MVFEDFKQRLQQIVSDSMQYEKTIEYTTCRQTWKKTTENDLTSQKSVFKKCPSRTSTLCSAVKHDGSKTTFRIQRKASVRVFLNELVVKPSIPTAYYPQLFQSKKHPVQEYLLLI